MYRNPQCFVSAGIGRPARGTFAIDQSKSGDNIAKLMRPPDLRIPTKIRDALHAYSEGIADRLEEEARKLRRPCVYFSSERVSDAPLRRTGFGKLFRRRLAKPILPITASKFGGIPYSEGNEDWNGWRFIGQFDLLEAARFFPESSLSGLLRIDISDNPLSDGLRVRWFSEPDPSKAKVVNTIAPFGKWEASHVFKRGWSLPHNERDWFSLLPGEDEQDDIYRKTGISLWDFWNDWEPTGFNEDVRDQYHTILGWPSGGLDEHYGFEAPSGYSDDISDYEMLLRLTFDNIAGFAWGTNWVYLLVPKIDLERGDLSHIVATGANS